MYVLQHFGFILNDFFMMRSAQYDGLSRYVEGQPQYSDESLCILVSIMSRQNYDALECF